MLAPAGAATASVTDCGAVKLPPATLNVGVDTAKL
jgi:hypothetical protein